LYETQHPKSDTCLYSAQLEQHHQNNDSIQLNNFLFLKTAVTSCGNLEDGCYNAVLIDEDHVHTKTE
jgi:hypothetical protein